MKNIITTIALFVMSVFATQAQKVFTVKVKEINWLRFSDTLSASDAINTGNYVGLGMADVLTKITVNESDLTVKMEYDDKCYVMNILGYVRGSTKDYVYEYIKGDTIQHVAMSFVDGVTNSGNLGKFVVIERKDDDHPGFRVATVSEIIE